MTPFEALNAIRAAGGDLTLTGREFTYRAPGEVTPELEQAMHRHRDAIRRIVREETEAQRRRFLSQAISSAFERLTADGFDDALKKWEASLRVARPAHHGQQLNVFERGAA